MPSIADDQIADVPAPDCQPDGAEPLVFVSGGGEMAALIRAYDWSRTPLGDLARWSQPLKTLVGLMLASTQPMFLAWGPERTWLYNDAFIPILGRKHPKAVGRPGLDEVWSEARDALTPLFDRVFAGAPVHMQDISLMLDRRGRLEEAHFAFSYTPARDETGNVLGLFGACFETTEQVLADRRQAAAQEKQRRMFEQAPSFVCILQGPLHVFEFVNKAHRNLFNSAGWIGKPVREAFSDLAGQGYFEILDHVYASGARHLAKAAAIRYRRSLDGPEEERLLDFIFEPLTDEAGRVTGIFCEGFDVTEAQRAETAFRASEARQALLLALMRGQRETEDPDQMMAAAAESIGRLLGVNRVGFFEVADNGDLCFGKSWADGVLARLEGRWPCSNIGTRNLVEVRAGRTLAISDTARDPLTADSRFGDIGARAIIGAPIIRAGRWHAGLYVNHATGRDWTDEEVALVREVAELTWDAVERARAVAAMLAAERALRRSEEQLRLATEAAEVGLWDMDIVTGILFWPPRVKAMFGISPDVPVSMADFYAGLHPDDREWTSAAFAAAVDPGRRALYDVEYRTVGKEDRVTRWVAAKGRGLFDEHGACIRVIGTAIDVTARKVAEERLRELNETLERRVAEALAERKILAEIVESTDAFIQVLDTDYRWLAINRASANEFERTLGVRPQAGDSVLELLRGRPDYQAFVKAMWSRALSGEEFTTVDKPEDLQLDQRNYEMKFNTLRDRDGAIIGAYLFAYDVTERLRDQARLADAEEQLRQAQKIEAIGQLTGGVAHDFNNLLQVISGGLSILDKQQDPDRRRRVFDAMRQATARGASLSRQLLAFSRRQPLRPEPVDVARQVDDMRDLLDRTLRGDVRVETRFPPDVWPVKVDPAELELAMLNLCVNARDAMPQGGTITISGENAPQLRRGDLQGDFVRLSVTDTGMGMSKEVLERVFEPFFTTKEIGKGSGLGLPQVYGFAKQSGGAAQLTSTLGHGTTATLLLPRSLVARRAPSRRAEEAESDLPARSAAGTVLLVEDDEKVAALVSEMLNQLGYMVLRTASADGALGALANDRPVDVVLSDIMMPNMNGVELAREIRRRRPGLPILLMSGYAEPARRDAQAERIEVLAKPYGIDELAASLRRALGRHMSPAS